MGTFRKPEVLTAELEAAWGRNMDALENAGYPREASEWERTFWEAGYKQALQESTDSGSTHTGGE